MSGPWLGTFRGGAGGSSVETDREGRPVNPLTAGGVAVSLDDLSRPLLDSGRLAHLVDRCDVTHVTTNPSIVAAAVADESYDERIAALAADGLTSESALWRLVTDDVRDACDLLIPAFERTGGVDGRVSVEIDPRLARDAESTVEQGLELVEQVGRSNVLVKVPACAESLPAITALLAAGVGVNVTVMFGLDRYEQVLEAVWSGWEAAAAHGHDLSRIASVASVYVSRVDVEARFDKLGLATWSLLRGTVATALARLTYRRWEESLRSPRWQALSARGARAQRLLFASVVPQDPALDSLHHVRSLLLPGTVCTMPGSLVEMVAGTPRRAPVAIDEAGERATLQAVGDAGVDIDDVCAALESQCLDRFTDAWDDALARTAGPPA